MVTDLDTHSARILLVDDEPDNLILLERMLGKEGYTNLVSESDSRKVAQLYTDNDFDLVLLDINMPHMDGFEVMAQLTTIEKSDYLPVLVLTALVDRETRLRALECGAKDFITKPFDRTEIVTRIRNILHVRLLHKQLLTHNKTLEKKVYQRTLKLVDQTRELEETRLEVIRRLGRSNKR